MAQENIFAPVDMGFLKAVAMYDAGFVGSRRTLSPFFHCRRGCVDGHRMDDEVLKGLAMMLSPFVATADVGFLVASAMDHGGLSVRRRRIGPWFASGMGFCGCGDGGLRNKDKGMRVEAPCFGATRGLGLCWSRIIRLGTQDFETIL